MAVRLPQAVLLYNINVRVLEVLGCRSSVVRAAVAKTRLPGLIPQ